MAPRKKEEPAKAREADQEPTGEVQAPPDEPQADSIAESPAEGNDHASFPIVGIGASAGGLAAFEEFFANMPASTESGIAFVLVQHLDPDHKSILTDLVKKYTEMKVTVVTDGLEVQPNCTYIIPPNKDMAFMHGRLHLMEPAATRGLRLPIDYFFRSLAQDQRERAICIVLSGTGTDGTLGLKEVKGQGGMTMVQDPNSAHYDGMPRSAIATGKVDFCLPLEQMPARLIAYVDHALGRYPRPASVPPSEGSTDALHKVFVLLRDQTGHDFAHYKQNTIHRRIERRMVLNQIDQLDSYVRHLQQSPLEVETLFRDLLIGVTSFFRDAEAFEALAKQVIVPLVAGHDTARPLRIWVPGCSTGDEAFSIAMLVQEISDGLRKRVKAQVFATDIDAEAIDRARAGVYPDSISADVSPERLARFFHQDLDSNTYVVRKSIRDMVIFATQNVTQDPPFSKMDLISCRNLLIYMGPTLQKRIIPLFHYSLNPGGWLFLGNSETIGEFTDLFGTVDRKWKLLQRKGGPSRKPAPDFALPAYANLPEVLAVPGALRPQREHGVRELAEQILLEQHTPASAIINVQGEVLYIHGRTGRYLELPPGEVSHSIIRMAREGLRMELTTAIRNAIAQKTSIHYPGLQVKTDGGMATVNMEVSPITKPNLKRDLLMVVFQDAIRSAEEEVAEPSPGPDSDKDQRIRELERELGTMEEYLQATFEELETSQEELQSVNEELVTVNSELQKGIDELTRTNNDMSNLSSGTGVGTLFIDSQLIIQRFTPSAADVINLIQSDVGRPVGHIASNLDYDRLVDDVRGVLADLIPREAEVQTTDDRWYVMKALPYRTVENVIDGVVLTFVEITELKRLRDLSRLAVVVRDSNDAITVQNLEGRILAWNPAAERMFG